MFVADGTVIESRAVHEVMMLLQQNGGTLQVDIKLAAITNFLQLEDIVYFSSWLWQLYNIGTSYSSYRCICICIVNN